MSFAGVSFTEVNSKTLEKLLLENGGIKNQTSFQIYKSTLYKLQKQAWNRLQKVTLLLKSLKKTNKMSNFRIQI